MATSLNNEKIVADEAVRQKPTDDSLETIFYNVSKHRGDEFFQVLARDLARALDVFYVIAGRIARGEDGDVCNTIAVWAGDDHIPNITYSLADTPCRNVADQQMCFHPRDIQACYPKDRLLVEMNAVSYLGMPMVDTEGHTLGILVAMDTKPMSPDKRNQALSLLTIFATRAAAELQFQDREAELRKLVDERTVELRDAKESAELANRAKSEFLAMMSHDLRTPLNAIMGFAEMMTSRTFGPLGDPHYEEYAKNIHDGGSLLVNLIDDILDLSRIEAGKMELVEEDLDVGNLIETNINLIRAEAEASRLRLSVDIPSDLPSLRADERMIIMLVNNVLSNAVKFTPEGGEISISAEVLEQGSMTISVADTGIGLSENDIAKALEPFEQIDSVHSRKHEGTGLGLFLCVRYAQIHGGVLTVESEVGKGTTVTVRFPPERTIRPS